MCLVQDRDRQVAHCEREKESFKARVSFERSDAKIKDTKSNKETRGKATLTGTEDGRNPVRKRDVHWDGIIRSVGWWFGV